MDYHTRDKRLTGAGRPKDLISASRPDFQGLASLWSSQDSWHGICAIPIESPVGVSTADEAVCAHD
jgi:hypothetical protein